MIVEHFAGDNHPGYPAIILGGNPTDDSLLPSILAHISESLAFEGITDGLCDGVSWVDLCGEYNAQANDLPAGLFIHMELNEQVRTLPGALISSLAEVFRTGR